MGANRRNYGIDALRILSMFMIVALHTLGHGGALKAAAPASAGYRVLWLLETAAYCAVNCFALVSGFVGLRSRFRLSAIAALWLQVLFYHAIFTVAWAILDGRAIDLPLIARALQPVKTNAYWYYTAYFGISFLVPLVNAAVEHLDRKTLIFCAVGLILTFSVYPTLGKADIFKLGGGYHAAWLLLLYFLGACAAKQDPFPGWGKWVWALVYAAAVVVSWGVKMLGLELNLISYTSPTVLLCALALVLLFSRLEPGAAARRVITLVSPLTFGVYLIHDSQFIRNALIKDRLADAAPAAAIKVIAFAAAVFAACLGVDYIRSILFRDLRIKERLDSLEISILEKINIH